MTKQEELLNAINSFMKREYDEEHPYEAMDEVPSILSVAYTTTESGQSEVQVNFNLEKVQYEEYINDVLVFVHPCRIEGFINDLYHCNFDDIISDILFEAERREEHEENKLSLEDFSKERLCELATWAIQGLIEDDYESAIEYFRGDMDMTTEEMEFFGVTMKEGE